MANRIRVIRIFRDDSSRNGDAETFVGQSTQECATHAKSFGGRARYSAVAAENLAPGRRDRCGTSRLRSCRLGGLRHATCDISSGRESAAEEAIVREINHILCPVDFSPASKTALAYAFAWAEWFGAQVHVLHVVPIPLALPGVPGVVVTLKPESTARTQSELRAFADAVSRTAVPYELRILYGDAAAVIADQAKTYQNVLVILGSRGMKGLERIVLGSVSERVLHRMKVPALVLPATNEAPLLGTLQRKRIVCGVNLRLSSLEALRYALSLAAEWDASLRIVSVIEPLAAVLPLGTPAHLIAEHQQEQRQEAIRAIRQHVPDEARQACTVHEEVYMGDAVSTLLQVAEGAEAELLIVGAGDWPHLSDLWRGHTTDHLVRHATCPVLIVPTPAAVRRAAAVKAPPKPRAEWPALWDRINTELRGHLTSVILIDPEMSALPEVTALPLTGIVPERNTAGEEAIELILGDREQSHLTHVIERPTELRVERLWLNGIRLLISDAGGERTLVEISGLPQPSPEAIAAANPLF
jgi:nucleotide-binding universal stress UspA family protein